MSRGPDGDDPLESLLARTLRPLPARRAPAGLEARVQRELARRAALPWWRRSFPQWPAAVRALFLLASAALISLSLLGGARLIGHLRPLAAAGGPAAAWQGHLTALWAAAADLLASLVRAVPSGWLEAGMILMVLAYGCLFGLGAAAYRTFHTQR